MAARCGRETWEMVEPKSRRVSWWESRAAIVGFAGSDIEAAVFYPEDDEYLVDRETTVSHFEVAAAQAG